MGARPYLVLPAAVWHRSGLRPATTFWWPLTGTMTCWSCTR
jgi:hypothetical protein